MSAPLTLERLKTLVHYDSATGVFTRLVTAGGKAKAGDTLCSKHIAGYRLGGIDGRNYLLHRLAWFYVYGAWPAEIDHINRDRTDNRIANLRECDRRGNTQNQSAHADGSSGLLGVSFHRGARKWMAQIVVDGKHYYLGLFTDKHRAGEAYLDAKRRLHTFAGEGYTP